VYSKLFFFIYYNEGSGKKDQTEYFSSRGAD